MLKKYTAFFSCFFLPMLLLSNGCLRAAETDSLFQQLPQVLTSSNNLYIGNTNVYITKNTDLIVTGDLILNNADIAGQGSVILKSNQKQALKSTNSTISNLEIQNPLRVTLTGDLTITQSLVIDMGIFDISKANLQINPNHIFLTHNGSLYTGNEAQFKMATETAPIPQADSLTANNNTATQNTKVIIGYSKKARLFFQEQHYSNATQNLLLQPPRLA